jgi:hypothetical protein
MVFSGYRRNHCLHSLNKIPGKLFLRRSSRYPSIKYVTWECVVKNGMKEDKNEKRDSSLTLRMTSHIGCIGG